MPTKKNDPKKGSQNLLNKNISENMIENSPFLILRERKDATITYINKSVEKFFGIDRKNFIGKKKWLADLSNEEKKIILNYLETSSNELKTLHHFTYYKLKNGETKVVEWFTTPLIDQEGNFLDELEAFGIDVTEKFKIQNQLEETINQLNLFFQQSLDGFFLMQTDEPIEWNSTCNKDNSLRMFYHNLKITKVNKAFLDQYGAKEKQMVGLSPADFFVHNYNYGIDVCKKILDAGSIILTTDERKFNGKQIWIEAQYSLIKNDAGLIIGLFGIQRDVTEKVSLLKELRENEAIFRNSFENNPQPVWIFDVDTSEIIAVNKAAIEHYGYTKKEFLQMKLKDINHPDSLPLLEKTLINLRKDIKVKTTTFWKHVKKDSSTIDVEISAQDIPYKNRRARINVITDISEKLFLQQSVKSREESYIDLFNVISDAIYIQDKDGRFLDVNYGAVKMYGYDREEFIGKTPEFLSAPGRNDLQTVWNMIQSTFHNGITNTFEYWGLKKDGTIFPKDVTINKGKYFGKDVVIAVARDISERKKNELTLNEAKNNFETVFNQINEAIIIHDFDGNILEANLSTLDLYGFNKEQIKKLTIHDLSADINMQHFRLTKIWNKVKTEGNIVFEWKAKKSDGVIFDIEVSLTKNIWSGSEVIFAIIRDLTEQKKAEIKSKESEESYFGLFNTITDEIFILNFDGTIHDCNKAALQNLGYKKEELCNKSFSLISSTSKNDFQLFTDRLSTTFYSGNQFRFDFWLKKMNGENFPAEIVLVRDKYEGKFVVLAIARDISERIAFAEQIQQSESRLRKLYDNSLIGIFRSTVNGQILFSNPALANILGFSSTEELMKVDTKKLYRDESTRNKLLDELKKTGKVSGSEFELIKKDGTVISVKEYSTAVKDESGNILYLEGMLEDITIKKKAETAILESEKYLKELNATKDKFFSIIAHDLRSPFQGLLGLANILAEEEMDPAEKDFYFKKMYEGLKNLFSFVEELLTWGRIQIGTLEFEPKLNSLNTDIEEISFVVNDLADKKGINLKFEIEENLTGCYDKNMISTVIRNLITNAIKFTPTLGNIIVKGYQTPTEILVSVTDSGIGISEEDIKKLFRLDSTFTRRGTNEEPGTGLGLILCKEFINKHNGKIWLESEVGKGSTFSFSLPKKLE